MRRKGNLYQTFVIVFLVLNVVLLLKGASLTGFGVWAVLNVLNYHNVTAHSYTIVISGSILAVGVITVLLALTCVLAVWLSSKTILWAYSTMFLLMIVAEIAGCVLMLVFQDQVLEKISGNIKDSQKNYHLKIDVFGEEEFGEPAFTKTWDAIQKDFQCCGSTRPKSWLMINPHLGSTLHWLPRSCCVAGHESCRIDDSQYDSGEYEGVTSHPDGGDGDGGTFNQRGCTPAILSYIRSAILAIVVAGSVLVMTQLLAVVAAVIVTRLMPDQLVTTIRRA